MDNTNRQPLYILRRDMLLIFISFHIAVGGLYFFGITDRIAEFHLGLLSYLLMHNVLYFQHRSKWKCVFHSVDYLLLDVYLNFIVRVFWGMPLDGNTLFKYAYIIFIKAVLVIAILSIASRKNHRFHDVLLSLLSSSYVSVFFLSIDWP